MEDRFKSVSEIERNEKWINIAGSMGAVIFLFTVLANVIAVMVFLS